MQGSARRDTCRRSSVILGHVKPCAESELARPHPSDCAASSADDLELLQAQLEEAPATGFERQMSDLKESARKRWEHIKNSKPVQEILAFLDPEERAEMAAAALSAATYSLIKHRRMLYIIPGTAAPPAAPQVSPHKQTRGAYAVFKLAKSVLIFLLFPERISATKKGVRAYLTVITRDSLQGAARKAALRAAMDYIDSLHPVGHTLGEALIREAKGKGFIKAIAVLRMHPQQRSMWLKQHAAKMLLRMAVRKGIVYALQPVAPLAMTAPVKGALYYLIDSATVRAAKQSNEHDPAKQKKKKPKNHRRSTAKRVADKADAEGDDKRER